jgi:hypothetical protein
MRPSLIVATILGFAFLMPPVGALVFVLTANLMVHRVEGAHFGAMLVANAFVFLLAVPFAFIYAAVPATCSGVAVAALLHNRPDWFSQQIWKRAALSGLVGLLICAVYTSIIDHFLPEQKLTKLLWGTLFITAIGGISAALVGCVIPRRSWFGASSNARWSGP